MTTTTFAVSRLDLDASRAAPKKALLRGLVAVAIFVLALRGGFPPAGYPVYGAFLVYAFAQLRATPEALGLVDRLAVPALLFAVLGVLAPHPLVLAALVGVALVLHGRASAAVQAGEVGEMWRVPFSLAVGFTLTAFLAGLGAAGLVLALVVAVLLGRRQTDALLPLAVAWSAFAAGALLVGTLAVVAAGFLKLTQRRLVPRTAPLLLRL